jgi:hypothetical protein
LSTRERLHAPDQDQQTSITAIQPVGKPTIFYDTELTGFGLKVQPSGASSWIIEYRPGAGGRSVAARRLVLGRLNTLTPDEARKLAATLLAKVKLGADPAAERSEARKAENVGELLDLFMDNHIRPKRKPRTVVLFEGYVWAGKRPLPYLGAKLNGFSGRSVKPTP